MSDDDTQKKKSSFAKALEDKKFNPYLTPTEHEDDPKLVEEDEEPRINTDENEENLDDASSDDGDIVVEQMPEEQIIEEEDVFDERAREPEYTHDVPHQQEPAPKPRSWSYQAAALLFILLFADLAVQRLGAYFFWTPRSMYLLSFTVRTLVMFIMAYAWHRSVFSGSRRELLMIATWIGVVSGGILGMLRFMGSPSFWSFINMVIEPIDSGIIAFLAALIVVRVASKLSITNTKQTI